jgi:hypothetical protein
MLLRKRETKREKWVDGEKSGDRSDVRRNGKSEKESATRLNIMTC